MTSISFKDRVVIITGAGGSLGRTYALEIAKRGGAVVVNDLGSTVEGLNESTTPADEVVAQITAAGGRAIASYDDVATRQGARRIVESALEKFGRVDALINNAGNLRNAWFEDLEDEDRDAQIAVHLLGTFNVTQAVWPHMKAQGYGRIVFTSSSAGMLGNEMQSAYGAAKAGITGLMNVLSQEGKPHGILCNALMPNAISRMGDQMSAESIEKMRPYVSRIYAEMEPTFTTGLAVYLASEACTSTHSIYSSLGGRMARVFIGVTKGWRGPAGRPATVEEIAANFDRIRDPARGFDIPESLGDEYRIMVENLDGAS